MAKVELDKISVDISTNGDYTEAFLSIDNYPPDISTTEIFDDILRMCREQFKDYFQEELFFSDVQKLVLVGIPFQNQLIAKGAEPIHGEDAKIIYHFPPLQDKPTPNPNQTCDFKNIQLFQSIGAKEPILTKLKSPGKGTDGKTVYGKNILPHPGRNITLILKKNVTSEVDDEDGRQVVKALVDGHLSIEDRGSTLAVEVIPVILILGDVDYSTGNIRVKSSLEITGSVLTGFSVKATGNITINGSVEPGAKVYSDGNILIRGGVLGNGPDDDLSEVKAIGTIKAMYAENARIFAEKDVYLGSSLNSNIFSNGDLYVDRNIIGGTVMALGSVRAGEIGNSHGVKTTIFCGVSFAASPKLDVLKKILKDMRSKLIEAEKNLNYLMMAPPIFTHGEIDEKVNKIEPKIAQLKKEIARLESKKAEWDVSSVKECKATISAEMFYPESVLFIRALSYHVISQTHCATFFIAWPEMQIEFSFYQPGKRM